MKKAMKTIWIILVAGLVLTACSLPVQIVQPQPQPAQPNPQATDPNQDLVKTLEFLQTKMAQSPVPASPTSVPQNTLAPSSTPIPSITPTLTSTVTQTSTVPIVKITPLNSTPSSTLCNKASFVMDVTVPDGKNYAKGATFVKTWRIKNDGTCTWTTNYDLVFDHGDSMSGPNTVKLPASVSPGNTIDLSVSLKAPSSNGTYQGFWKLQDGNGNRFGIGEDAKISFWVKITVGSVYKTAVSGGECQIISVSPAAYSEFSRGAQFDSKWKIKNVSGKRWNDSELDYKYISGEEMYKYEHVYDLPTDVEDNKSITLTVDSIAPDAYGTYTMTWGITRGSSVLCYFSVTIKVK